MRAPHPGVDHQALAARLRRGEETEEDRAYLADMLEPARERARARDFEMVWRVLSSGEDDGPASIRKKSQERRIEGAGVGRSWFFKVKKRYFIHVEKPAPGDLCSGLGSGSDKED
jgi:hypothetical protein